MTQAHYQNYRLRKLFSDVFYQEKKIYSISRSFFSTDKISKYISIISYQLSAHMRFYFISEEIYQKNYLSQLLSEPKFCTPVQKKEENHSSIQHL